MPCMETLTVLFEAEIDVEVAGFESTIVADDVAQAVQDDIGHTGAKVTDVISFSAAQS